MNNLRICKFRRAVAGNSCDPFSGTAGTGRTATTVDFVIDANAVGTSPVAPAPMTGRDICFAADGTTAIAAQDFTVGATVVAAAGSTATENAAPELLGLAALCHGLMSANEFLYVD